jgi:hypothetical protein
MYLLALYNMIWNYPYVYIYIHMYIYISYYITLYNIVSHYIISYIILNHVNSYYIILYHHIISYHVISCHLSYIYIHNVSLAILSCPETWTIFPRRPAFESIAAYSMVNLNDGASGETGTPGGNLGLLSCSYPITYDACLQIFIDLPWKFEKKKKTCW